MLQESKYCISIPHREHKIFLTKERVNKAAFFKKSFKSFTANSSARATFFLDNIFTFTFLSGSLTLGSLPVRKVRTKPVLS